MYLNTYVIHRSRSLNMSWYFIDVALTLVVKYLLKEEYAKAFKLNFGNFNTRLSLENIARQWDSDRHKYIFLFLIKYLGKIGQCELL
jgi:hypothetical protein